MAKVLNNDYLNKFLGIIHLVCMQKLQKFWILLAPSIQIYVFFKNLFSLFVHTHRTGENVGKKHI